MMFSRNFPIALVLGVCALTLLGSAALAQTPDQYKGDPYTLDVCVVSGEKLGTMGDPILVNHEGRDIRLCCAGCTAGFKAEPSKFISKVDALMIVAQSGFYPLDTDVVSGDALGDAPIDVIHNNRLVRFASQMSAQKFYRSPDKYLAKLNEAVIAAQVKSYPLETCIVSGETLTAMGDPIQVVAGNQLVQFCCAGCVNEFWKSPAATLSKLASGEGAAKGEEGSDHKHGDQEHGEH